MKLHYSRGASSRSPHICLREPGLAFTPVLASFKTKKLADGSDLLAVNSKGQVPLLLELDDGQNLAWVDQQLQGRLYLMGNEFTVADAHLYAISGWGKYAGVDIAPLKNLSAWVARMAARPAVQEALKAEGLLK